MGQASCPTDAPTGAGHSFNEIGIQQLFALLEQGNAALFNTVTGGCFQLKIGVAMLLDPLGHRFRQTAAAGKNASEVGGLIQHSFLQRSDIDFPAVKKRL